MSKQRRAGRRGRRTRRDSHLTASTIGAFGALGVAGLGVYLVVQSITEVSVGEGAARHDAVAGASITSRLTPPPSDDPDLWLVPGTSATSTPQAATVPTLELAATRGSSFVEVRVPGGRVLFSGTLTSGKRLVYTEPRVQVTLGNSAAVEVVTNGTDRRRGGVGVREVFEVKRA